MPIERLNFFILSYKTFHSLIPARLFALSTQDGQYSQCSVKFYYLCHVFSLECLCSIYFGCVTRCSKTSWCKIAIYSSHGFSGLGSRTGQHSGDDFSPPCRMFGPQPENTEAEDRNRLKARALMDLLADARYRWGSSFSPCGPLHVVTPCGLVGASSQHTAWWRGPKDEHPVKERTRQKLNNLGSHAVMLLPHSVHQGNYKVLLKFKGRGHRLPTLHGQVSMSF